MLSDSSTQKEQQKIVPSAGDRALGDSETEPLSTGLLQLLYTSPARDAAVKLHSLRALSKKQRWDIKWKYFSINM